VTTQAPFTFHYGERREHLLALLRWLPMGALVGVVCGAGSALFLWLLERATGFRDGHEAIIYALPLAGLLLGWVQQRYGQAVRAGNSLVIDTIHDDGPEIPFRMAPLVLGGTVLTHLFGGSAGREGTAVQMGASLTDWLSHRLALSPALRRQLLAAGVAGGFGSVFGTPVAGAVFGLEFVVLGRIEYGALVPALAAALVGDLVTRGLGIVHTAYPAAPVVALDLPLLGKWVVFAVAMALAAAAFIELTHALRREAERRLPWAPGRLFIGGVAVVLLWRLAGTSDYLGLGLPGILRAFTDPAQPPWAFALKLLFTAVTIGFGFLGGEVTPLFFIGAALGNLLAQLLGLPLALGAGVGLAAVFAAASNTPLALSLMALELLGVGAFPHVVVVCVIAWVVSGRRSIYPAQLRARGAAPAPRTDPG
jgi:H+/Cl- antiporter ClcA